MSPPICVIDGKHRFAAAAMRGEQTILAWVGELAAAKIDARPQLKLADVSKPKVHRLVGAATTMDKVMALTSRR